MDEQLARELNRVAETEQIDLRLALQDARAQAPKVRRRRRRVAALSAAAAVAAVAVVAMIATRLDRPGEVTPAADDSPVIVTATTLNAYPAAEVIGRLDVEGDCLIVGGRIALFPPGTTFSNDALTLPSGSTTVVGSQAHWSGGYFELDSTRDMSGSEDTYRALQRCGASTAATEVALVAP